MNVTYTKVEWNSRHRSPRGQQLHSRTEWKSSQLPAALVQVAAALGRFPFFSVLP